MDGDKTAYSLTFRRLYELKLYSFSLLIKIPTNKHIFGQVISQNNEINDNKYSSHTSFFTGPRIVSLFTYMNIQNIVKFVVISNTFNICSFRDDFKISIYIHFVDFFKAISRELLCSIAVFASRKACHSTRKELPPLGKSYHYPPCQ